MTKDDNYNKTNYEIIILAEATILPDKIQFTLTRDLHLFPSVFILITGNAKKSIKNQLIEFIFAAQIPKNSYGSFMLLPSTDTTECAKKKHFLNMKIW